MRTSTNVFTAVIFAILCVNSVLAAPIPKTKRQTAVGAGSGPWFVVYTDRGPDPAPAVSQIQGFNVVIMSFLLSTGAADMAETWASMSASDRSTIKQQYQSAGIKLLVSAFGSTETPTTSNKDPQTVAAAMAAWVKQYGVDGIDVDYEDSAAMNKGDGKTKQWLIAFTTALRSALPQGQYILTHAPMAPWMGVNSLWKSGAYVTVNKQVGSQIDWYNTQFYNQGASEYTTCAGLLTTSSSNSPKSSVFEIQANGFDLSKIVIGKPGATADASNGQMSTSTLAQCVSQAKGKGWNAGVMSWKYPDANSAWISAVRSSAFPVGGSPAPGSSASAGATPTTGTDPGSAPLAGPSAPLAGSSAPPVGSPDPLAGSSAPLAGSSAPLASSSAPLAGSSAPLDGSSAPLASSSASASATTEGTDPGSAPLAGSSASASATTEGTDPGSASARRFLFPTRWFLCFS
ncbi:glycoside hydrolase superfamily [Rhodocollybia butyracea]|uniref:chitinase n=1 Tax=Rhodocollybia butyracea TaxID=206335 RepID=A0A9P5U3J9_9AGAR|nr:glycoside hydrolase superfamily [Rhodocollybia butyracea]